MNQPEHVPNNTAEGDESSRGSSNLQQSQHRFRGKVGESLRTNKAFIIGAIIIVFFVHRVDFISPDLRPIGVPLGLFAIWAISWLKRAGWSDLGIFRPKNWIKTILLGLGVGLIVQSFALLQIKLGGPLPDLSSFAQIKDNLWVLFGFLLVSWISAGFGEEIIWRGFFMQQIARLFEQKKIGWAVGLILSSVVFGLIHAYQGVTGIVMTGMMGLLYGSIMLISGGNLWTAIFAHAFTDTFGFLMLYYWDTISKLFNL